MNNLIEFPTEIDYNRVYERAKQYCDGYGYKEVKPTQDMINFSMEIEKKLISSKGAIYNPYIMMEIKKYPYVMTEIKK